MSHINLDGAEMGLNYDALDSFEFEVLARDVAESITGVRLSCYTEGADGGVDASDYYYQAGQQGQVVMQAKHWKRYVSANQWTDTVEQLIDRLEQANKVPSDSLVIVTSASLTEDVQHGIIELVDTKCIHNCLVIDRVKLDDFLQREENRPILKRHFKLWIAGTNVLNIMLNRSIDIDTETFLDSIDERRELYIQTNLFDKAIELLRRNSILLIVGDPGTGKSILTEMIALQLAAAKYQVVYSSCNNINGLKSSVSSDCENTLFVLDDFLGQRCLDIDSSKMRELVCFLKYISKFKSCRVVLNSRISILNEARRRDDAFNRLIEGMGVGFVLINTSDMSLLDKARIFISNLAFEKVPTEYVNSLTKREESVFTNRMKCVALCEHANYNPRIIEYCSRRDSWEGIAPSGFPAMIKERLDHPNDVWRNEFEVRLDKSERILAYQLFSLGDKGVPVSALRKAYDARMSLETHSDRSVDTFSQAFKRLQETIIKTVYLHNEPYVSMANPSVNDYCAWFLTNNKLESIAMASSFVFADQLERITKVNQCPEVVSILRDAVVTNRMSRSPVANEGYKLFGSPVFRAIANCEESLSVSDFQWVADYISSALGSTESRNWEQASGYLFDRPHKWGIVDSPQVSQIICTESLLRNLTAGTSYVNAALLFSTLLRIIKQDRIKDGDALLGAICARSGEWLSDYAVDYIDEWINDNCSPDTYIQAEALEDDEEWEDFIRDCIRADVKLALDENSLEDAYRDCLCDELADCLKHSDYVCEFENALDTCILNISIPVRDFDSVTPRSSNSLLDRSREIQLVERLFDGYRAN